MKKYLHLLLLFCSSFAVQQAKAQLHLADAAALAQLQLDSFISPSYIIPTSAFTAQDSSNLLSLGVFVRRVPLLGGNYRVIELNFSYARNDNGTTAPYPIDRLFNVFNGNNDERLQFLELLDLSGNRMYGDFSLALPLRTRLKNVNLNYNRVSPLVIRVWLEAAETLEQLYIDGGLDTNAISLFPLPVHNSLRVLDLNFNRLTSVPLDLFTNFPNIEYLKLGHNRINALPAPNTSAPISIANYTSAAIPQYSGLTKLKEINLSFNNLRGLLAIEHFIAPQLQASATTPRPLQSLKFNNNHFDEVADSMAREFLSQNTAILGNALPSSPFPFLFEVNVSNNALQFNDLFTIAIMMGKRMTLPADVSFSELNYAPQDSIGIGGVRRRAAGQALDFELAARDRAFRPNSNIGTGLLFFGAIRNNYTWVWGDETAILTNNTSRIYTIAQYQQSGAGASITSPSPGTSIALDTQAQYLQARDAFNNIPRPQIGLQAHNLLEASFIYSTVTNDKFPALTLTARKKRIRIGECFDNLGEPINCQEIAVQLRPNADPAQVQAARDELGATVVNSCVCGSIELWALADTFQQVSMEANGAGTRLAAGNASAKPGLKSADGNYPLGNYNYIAADLTPNLNIQGNRNPNTTLVAIIDSGTDPDHPRLSPFIHYNTSEVNDSSNTDADANCENNDIIGYNYLDRTNSPYDDHGHGTIGASIIAGFGLPNIAANNADISILPIKYTNRNNHGTTFEASCAIFYAADHHINRTNGNHSTDSVRVINASWGYTGESCQVLKDAIEYAGNSCGILFVCSAGNETSDNDMVPHYPSNYPLENILAVGALNSDNSTLAAYSNYGTEKVDIATYGSFSNTLIPQVGTSVDSLTTAQNGTSFATALVSRAAAILFSQIPEASFHAVKHALLHTATPLAGNDASKIRSGSLDINAALTYFNQPWDKSVCAEILATPSLVSNNIEAFSKISPNPTNQNVQISFNIMPVSDVFVTVFDSKGSNISQQQFAPHNQIELSLSHLPQGFYIVKVQTNNQVQSHKLMKIN
jgi:subtilisin family serine protease/Leucine-rich repeat (LRR) protein